MDKRVKFLLLGASALGIVIPEPVTTGLGTLGAMALLWNEINQEKKGKKK